MNVGWTFQSTGQEAVTCGSSDGSLGDQSGRMQLHTPDNYTSYLLYQLRYL